MRGEKIIKTFTCKKLIKKIHNIVEEVVLELTELIEYNCL